MKYILSLFSSFLLLACGGNESSANQEAAPSDSTTTVAEYQNPVIRISAPDPTAIRVKDGTYYLYATEDIHNLPIFKSKDLVHWEEIGTAFTEETRPNFVDNNPEGKKAAETMCVCYKKQYGINAKIARLAHTFGPGMSIYDGRVQADFLKNVVNNEDIVLKSDGSAIRTYTYAGDAALALFYILLDSDDIVYNISSEESTVSIKQLAETLVEAFPERNLNLVFDIPEDADNSGCAPFTLGILGSDKLKSIGWKPVYSLEEGLKRTVEYIETGNK